MLDDYTALVEYLDAPNSCEVVAGGELCHVDGEDDDKAREAVASLLESLGHPQESYRLVALARGRFESADGLLAAKNEADEALAADFARADEERRWEEYISGMPESL
jgi:hypothetical protein